MRFSEILEKQKMKGSELILGRTKIADPRIIRWNWFTKGCLEESRCSSEMRQKGGKKMNDFISRQDAIEALKGLPTWWADEGGYYGGAQPPMVALLDPEDAVSAIENLLSVQPQPEEDCATCKHGYFGDRRNSILTEG